MMPPESERLRIERIESAVLPMANAALEAGQLETARRLYTRLLEADVNSVEARIGLGDVALEERAPAHAANWYRAATIYAEQPRDLHRALLAHGRAALTAGDLEAAHLSFSRLADPQEQASKSHVAWGHNGIGIVGLLRGEPRVAVAALEKAVLSNPHEPMFRGNLTRALKIAANRRPDRPEMEVPASPGESHATSRSVVDGFEPSSPSPAMIDFEDTTQTTPLRAEPVETAESAIPHDAPAHPSAETGPSRPAMIESDPVESAPSESSIPVQETEIPTDSPQAPDAAPNSGPDGIASSGAVDASSEGLTQGHLGETPPVHLAVREPPPPPDAAIEAGSEADRGSGHETDTVANRPQSISGGFVVRIDDADYVQIGAFSKRDNASTTQTWLRGVIDIPVRIDDGDSLYRVRIGPITSRDVLPDLASSLGIDIPGSQASPAIPNDAPRDDTRDGAEQATEPAMRTDPANPLVVVEQDETFLQVGAYANHGSALALASTLRGRMDHPVVVSMLERGAHDPLYRVRIGPVAPPPEQSLLEQITLSIAP